MMFHLLKFKGLPCFLPTMAYGPGWPETKRGQDREAPYSFVLGDASIIQPPGRSTTKHHDARSFAAVHGNGACHLR